MSEQTPPDALAERRRTEEAVQRITNRSTWILAVGGIVVGAIGLLFPQTSLQAVALILGTYFIVVGIGRASTAITSDTASVWGKAVLIALAVLVLVVGVLCLNNPFHSVGALDVLVGVGLILDGLAGAAAALLLGEIEGRRAAITAAVVSAAVGVVVLILPQADLRLLLLTGAIGLVAIGVATVVAL